ncbi:MAG: glycosyltransferase family 2 protein [Candidatus Promineifilaceae bacterium]
MVASIIIPHWNGKQHLDDCLTALRNQTFRNFEILLVDNGSTDGSQAYIRETFPEVMLIELAENRGFTGACHAGWKASRGDLIILLNNDTEVDTNWLSEVVGAFGRYPEAGIVASKMLLFDKRDTFHTAGDLMYLNGTPNNRGVWQADEGQFDCEEYVFSACGGSSAYRRALLEEIGFLDDDFFFSCEDVDIGWRAQLAGWRCVYAPSAIVYHKLKATGGSVTGSYYDGRNFLFLLWKNYPLSLFKTHWRVVLGGQLKITREAIRHWRGEAARARLKGQLAGILGLPAMRDKRRIIQANRRVTDDYLLSILSQIDEAN